MAAEHFRIPIIRTEVLTQLLMQKETFRLLYTMNLVN
jgi:hypothetical protein